MAIRIAEPHFRVGELGEGQPFIVVENYVGDQLLFTQGLASFRLKAGTTYEQAQNICNFLRANIDRIVEQDF